MYLQKTKYYKKCIYKKCGKIDTIHWKSVKIIFELQRNTNFSVVLSKVNKKFTEITQIQEIVGKMNLVH